MEEHNNTPYILSELPDITSIICYPLQCTQRIKYTCFDVSKNLIVFGATSGGLYIFDREPCSFVQLIPNKEGTVTHIKISPDEKRAAFATAKGLVCVCDCGDAGNGAYVRSPLLQTSKEHQGNEITSIIWNKSGNELYIGDDTGLVSILRLTNFITASVFQTAAFPLMHLDTRIVQMDLKDYFLLVSTLTRSYICDTGKEQYKQIGQKLRDGEFGGCFYYLSKDDTPSVDNCESTVQRKDTEYNAIQEGESIIGNNDSHSYIKVFSARPGSRIWEVKLDGTVVCTHQFKNLLAIPPTTIITVIDFETQNYVNEIKDNATFQPQSFNFQKIYMFLNKFIFTFKRDGIYVLDPKNANAVLWSDKYTSIVDIKIIDGLIYIWLANGNFVTLSFCTLENFLLKCYVNEKYLLCGKIFSNNMKSIISMIPRSKKIHLITGLGEKLQDISEHDLYEKINPVLEEISKTRRMCGQKLKSGIFVVDNSYSVKAASQDGNNDIYDESDTISKTSSDDSDSMLFQISPDALQALKGFSNTVTDKLTSGTKSLKKTWDHLEDKMKKIGLENYINDPLDVKTANTNDANENSESNVEVVSDHEDIVANKPKSKRSSLHNSTGDPSPPTANKLIETPEKHIKLNNITSETLFSLLSEVSCDINKTDNNGTDYSLLSEVSCDINDIFKVINQVEENMVASGEQTKYSSYHCGKLLLQHISKTPGLEDSINKIIENEPMCLYFLQAFVNINSKMDTLSSCECGYPLPYACSSQTPLFSNLIDIFIEKRWNSPHSEQCNDICKKVPYTWRKILILRKNEDLLNLVLLILQLLDEDLLYSYLPQFTIVTWKKAINLIGTLKKSECLNCGRKFEGLAPVLIRNNNLPSWDSIGALMIKSVGCKNSTQILKEQATLIPHGELTIKFFHTCMFVKLFERYDSTVMIKLVDTLYEAYNYPDATDELTKHLSECIQSDLKHTALPLVVASKSSHWGLKISSQSTNSDLESSLDKIYHQPDLMQSSKAHPSTSSSAKKASKYEIGMTLEQTIDFLPEICPNKNCLHCCLPLESRVLIADGGLWVFACGHTFHGVCLTILKIKLCPQCYKTR